MAIVLVFPYGYRSVGRASGPLAHFLPVRGGSPHGGTERRLRRYHRLREREIALGENQVFVLFFLLVLFVVIVVLVGVFLGFVEAGVGEDVHEFLVVGFALGVLIGG